MPEKTRYDLLGVQIDSDETKFVNNTTIGTLKAVSPDGTVIFNTDESTIPGVLNTTASQATTSSYVNPLIQNVNISGNLTVNGTTYLNSIVITTASYSSGSTIFGDALTDTHQFTGSVFITGSSFTWNNSTVITSDITSSMSVTSASYAATASKIIIVNEATSPSTYYPIFANGTSGPVSLGADASTYTYQPSTNILTVTSSLALDISASSINSTNRQLIDAGGVASVQWNSYRLYNSSNNLVVHWGTGNLYSGSFVTSSVSWTDRLLRDSDGTVTVDWENALFNDSSGNTSVNVSPRRLHDSSTNVSIAWEDRNLLNSATTVVADWENHYLYDDASLLSMDWKRRKLKDPSENDSIDYENRQLIASDGTTVALDWSTLGDSWTAYTPSWTAASSNPSIGDGTLEGWYKVVGKTCFVRGNIVMGSTTTFGSGEWYVSMPFTASHADAILITANLLDNGTAWYNATLNGARAGFNYKTAIQYQNLTGTADSINATLPFTWTNSDRFLWNGSFEIA